MPPTRRPTPAGGRGRRAESLDRGSGRRGRFRLTEEVARLEAENAKLKDQLPSARSPKQGETPAAGRSVTVRMPPGTPIAKFAGDLLDPADNLRRAVEAAPSDAQDEALERPCWTASLGDRAGAAGGVRERHEPDPDRPAARREVRTRPGTRRCFEMPAAQHPPARSPRVMQPGYALNGRLVRLRRVGVAKGEPPQKVDTERVGRDQRSRRAVSASRFIDASRRKRARPPRGTAAYNACVVDKEGRGPDQPRPLTFHPPAAYSAAATLRRRGLGHLGV